MIVVSHDRYLLQQVADQVWVIEEQKITVHPQSYSEYQLSRSIGHRDGTAETAWSWRLKEIAC